MTDTYIDRADIIKTIRAALRRRSGKGWSVRGGTGTAWPWIDISSPPSRCDMDGSMTTRERAELGHLLGLDGPVLPRGVSVNYDDRREYIARAEGRTP
jgi:hypothetical protein